MAEAAPARFVLPPVFSVAISSRADSGVSSTATRAPGPALSFAKSIVIACSRATNTGWSYPTLT